MSESATVSRNRWHDGLWSDNPALVMLLGLCPLLAVSNSAINGIALGPCHIVDRMHNQRVRFLFQTRDRHRHTYPHFRLDHRDDGHCHRISDTSLFSRLASITGDLSTADRDQLSDSGQSRSVRFASGRSTLIDRRAFNGPWIFMGARTAWFVS